MSNHPSIESPRLQTLKEALQQGEAGVLESFWGETQERGTPLIESIEGDDENNLVTFLWRATEPIARLTLVSLLTDRDQNVFERMADTDLWFLSCVIGDNIRATYQFFPESKDDLEQPIMDPMERLARYRHDPLNPMTYVFERDEEDPDGFELTRSVLQMPKAPAQPWNVRQTPASSGEVSMHRFRSEILDNERRVWVYTPPNYDPSRREPYPVLVLFDGTGFVKMSPLIDILENLIEAELIPPLVAVMPCSLSQETRFRELLLHRPFNEFLADELMPWAHESYHLSDDPSQVVVAGASAGGLAAAYTALELPEIFGNVLSLSGAFLWKNAEDHEHESLTRMIAQSDQTPIRFYLTAGTLEMRSLREIGNGPNLVIANRHLRTVLQAKAYPVWLNEFPGGHDMISWQGEIPKGLITLLGHEAP